MTHASHVPSTEGGLCYPLKVEAIEGRKAIVSCPLGRYELDICLVSDLCVGDHVIAHGKMAISKMEDEDAKSTTEMLMSIKGSTPL